MAYWHCYNREATDNLQTKGHVALKWPSIFRHDLLGVSDYTTPKRLHLLDRGKSRWLEKYFFLMFIRTLHWRAASLPAGL